MLYAIGLDNETFVELKISTRWNGITADRIIEKCLIGAKNFNIFSSVQECCQMINSLIENKDDYELTFLPLNNNNHYSVENLKIFNLIPKEVNSNDKK